MDEQKVRDLMSQGLHCSQVMLLLADEMRGVSNPDTIRAAGGLGGGMFTRLNCGTLTGGACVLAVCGARSAPGEEPVYDYRAAVKELTEWFSAEFGSVQCSELVSEDRAERLDVCPKYVAKTFDKCVEILNTYGMGVNTGI